MMSANRQYTLFLVLQGIISAMLAFIFGFGLWDWQFLVWLTFISFSMAFAYSFGQKVVIEHLQRGLKK